jgi:hypothetical protein
MDSKPTAAIVGPGNMGTDLLILMWTAVDETGDLSGWAASYAPWLILGGLLAVGPEIASVSFGGFKMEVLRQTREEVARVGQTVQQIQLQQATAAAASVQNIKKQKNVTKTAAAAADVVTDTAKGQEAKRVPAEDVVSRFITGVRVSNREVSQDTTPYTAPDDPSTLVE